ncbi:MAG: hypothetical protein C5B46_03585 [Proteobacteria bacterium]|nr:MAG: hypothetical protein C5B46_03585 [Pseudomonadota bacterium]
MRINDPPLINVSRPDARGPLGGVAPAAPVTAQSPTPQTPQATPAERTEVQAPVPQVERRQNARRGTERRQRQVNVTLNTRVGQRRTSQRRAEDGEAPPSIDVEA